MVVNLDKTRLGVYGYNTGATSFSLLYTTPTEASIEYLGSHEVYWFPFKRLLMAKVSDGSSFRFFRIASNFRTVAAAGDASFSTSDKIDSGEFRLFHVPGRTMVPPVFWDRMAYFYLSGTTSTSVAKLVAYKWNELSNEFEKKCSKDLIPETTNTNIYHKFSLINTGADGVILITYNLTPTPTLYLCDASTGTYTETTVNYVNTAGALIGE
jgi:hypothetical protein